MLKIQSLGPNLLLQLDSESYFGVVCLSSYRSESDDNNKFDGFVSIIFSGFRDDRLFSRFSASS